MIGLSKNAQRSAATIQAANRGFSGGGSKPKPIDPKCTDYDIVFVGKLCTQIKHRTTQPF